MALDTIIHRLGSIRPWTKTSDERTVDGRRPVHEKTFKEAGFPFGGITDLGNANTIVPVLSESDGTYGRAVMVAQYRPGPEMFLFEFPGGNLKGNESDTGAALREMVEETGYLPNQLIPLGTPVPRDGYLEGSVQSFLSLGSQEAGKQDLDIEERDQGLFTLIAPLGEIAELMYGGNSETPGFRYHTSGPSAIAFERAVNYLMPRNMIAQKEQSRILAAQDEHYKPVLSLKSQ